MRLLVEPLRELLTGKLEVADQAFEAKQRELELKAMASADVSNSGRSYRIRIAAMNIQERRALAKIHLLYQSEDMWSLMPDSALTEADTAITFKLLSAEGCYLEELLLNPHRRYSAGRGGRFGSHVR